MGADDTKGPRQIGRGPGWKSRSALGELRRLASALQAVLLALLGTRVAGEKPALPQPLTGRVERVGLEVGKMDVIDTDPVAKTDARVVEVEIRIDGAPDFPLLTYLQVKVEISP